MSVDLSRHHHIHLVGIAGAGMSALARYLLTKGYVVSGSDRSPGPEGDSLRDAGARVAKGHAAENVAGADLVVISSAVPPENPEVALARSSGVPVIKRAELLASIANPAFGIAVAGTHGKSTTSALIGHVLTEAGLDPTILIGATSANLGSNARVGASDVIVVEADEYDASFLLLRPRVSVITNVEADHLDFYGSEDRVRDAFATFAQGTTDALVVCADDDAALAATRTSGADLVTYGLREGEWTARDVTEAADWTTFEAVHDGRPTAIRSRLSGHHNVVNVLAAIAVSGRLDVPMDQVSDAIASFQGVRRRMELRGMLRGATVLDDYAHHPTEMTVNLSAMRTRHPDTRILLVFQPHTYTRTRAFFDEFARALSLADRVYLLDIYAARETDTLGVHSRDLAAAAQSMGADVTYTGTCENAAHAVTNDLVAGDVLITMGAGDVHLVGDRLLEAERQTVTAGGAP